jgi:excisionase family DNA binding protein
MPILSIPKTPPRKARPALPPVDSGQRYSPEEAADYLRSSRWSVFKDLKEGRLRAIREGRRTFIPGTEIIRRSTLPTSESAAA